jgi:hypothetical protein
MNSGRNQGGRPNWRLRSVIEHGLLEQQTDPSDVHLFAGVRSKIQISFLDPSSTYTKKSLKSHPPSQHQTNLTNGFLVVLS